MQRYKSEYSPVKWWNSAVANELLCQRTYLQRIFTRHILLYPL